MKKNIKIILILIVVLIIACIAIPTCIKNYKVTKLEEKFYSSIDSALEYYDEYAQTGDVEQVNNIATELRVCQMSLLEIERINDLEKWSTDISMAISVLESNYNDLQGLEHLDKGMEHLHDNMYLDAGYSELLEFVNSNKN